MLAGGRGREVKREHPIVAVLTAGTLPIDMLEREVDTYIQSVARR